MGKVINTAFGIIFALASAKSGIPNNSTYNPTKTLDKLDTQVINSLENKEFLPLVYGTLKDKGKWLFEDHIYRLILETDKGDYVVNIMKGEDNSSGCKDKSLSNLVKNFEKGKKYSIECHEYSEEDKNKGIDNFCLTDSCGFEEHIK